MRLVVSTPMAVIVDADDVRHVRAEDETGAFGILPGHGDFMTALAVSIITWRDGKGREHHVAVRGGVLTVRDGALVEVATREAVGEETLGRLGREIIARYREEVREEEEARGSATRLHLALMRGVRRYLDSGRQIGPPSPTIPEAPPPGPESETGGTGQP